MSHLFWGGVDCVELASAYGTPLYVLDEGIVRARCAEIRAGFTEKWPNVVPCYAAKAFLTLAMARIVASEGLGMDVVSGGELHTALRAGFPPERLRLHGNAKSEEELRMALDAGVGCIVVDGPMELELLDTLAGETKKRPDILIRVAPGVEPHTHAHLVTGQAGSKFGLPLEGGLAGETAKRALTLKNVSLRGFHFHIGSQIFENTFHVEAVRRVVSFAADLKEDSGFETEELDFGGGFGVDLAGDRLAGDSHLPLRFFTDPMMETLTRECRSRGMARPRVSIEPGRWLVAEAGITLYRVETVKRLPGVTFIGVNGGMADNPRPALYQAEYRAALAGKTDAPAVETCTVAGKCCETGDILISSARLPEAARGDLLAVFATGAYNFSMAGNYNRLPRPALVLVHKGRSELSVARQTWEDLLAGDRGQPLAP